MLRKWSLVWLILLVTVACTPQPAPTATPSQRAIVVQDLPTVTETLPPTATATPAPTATASLTPVPSFTWTPSATPLPSATPNAGPEILEIGRSVQGEVIEAIRLGYGEKVILFIGGLHAGFAPATVQIAERTRDYFTENLDAIPPNITLYVIPNANPDSPLQQNTVAGRLNANGVDLNRNWDCRWTTDARFRGEIIAGSGGPMPFSEPETQTLRQFIEGVLPTAVVFWEAKYEGGFVSPGRCDRTSRVSYTLAEIYGRSANYRVDDFEIDTGLILNGDATNWLDQAGYPAVAVLLPDYDEMDWDNNLAGILAIIEANR